MSRVDSILPAGPLTVAPGDIVDFDVLVSNVPGDDTATLRGVASDGSTVTCALTIDRAALEGITSGSPKVHQVLCEVVGPGTVTSVGAVTGGWRFRYTAV